MKSLDVCVRVNFKYQGPLFIFLSSNSLQGRLEMYFFLFSNFNLK
jgi:hypothetical protein